MHSRITLQAFGSGLNDGLSFPLFNEGDTGVDVTADPVDWLNIYTQTNNTFGYNEQRITGIDQAITLSVSTNQGGLQRKVSSEPFVLDPNSGWTATADGASFSVSPNFYVGFRAVATKAGTSTTTVRNVSDGNVILDTFTSTVSASPTPPEYFGEFSAYGTGWRWMISTTASNQTYSLSYAFSQLLGTLTITDSNGDVASTTPILGNQFYRVYYPAPVNNTPVFQFRPSSVYGGNSVRAQNFINAFPNGYVKVYSGLPNTNGNQVRTFATKAVLPQNTQYVRFSGGSLFSGSSWQSDTPIRIEFYTS